eukprot:TRINITY_DN15686_c0_g2_i1.p1 TRINITY_DN15686_c0_g2~~TRINITY_DN15686_c0_g2_i1.p1  ORF type:complete len:120 (-),score=27.50 TRINITY_DN15686_c0_g2_i1:18-377(-)
MRRTSWRARFFFLKENYNEKLRFIEDKKNRLNSIRKKNQVLENELTKTKENIQPAQVQAIKSKMKVEELELAIEALKADIEQNRRKYAARSESRSTLENEIEAIPVSYTHLTLPTNREV